MGNFHTEWERYLELFHIAYNTASHETTGFWPFFLNHSREALLPWSDLVIPHDGDPQEADMWGAYTQTVLDPLQAHLKLVQKKYYDKTKARWDPKHGSLVGKRTHPMSSGPLQYMAKLAPRWEGPYRVIDTYFPLSPVYQ